MAKIKELQSTLGPQEALLIEHPIDILYLTGMEASAGKLLIECKAALHFLDGRYFEAGKQQSMCSVEPLEAFPKALKQWKRVQFDSTWCTVDQLHRYQMAYPKIEWIPIAAPTRLLRLIKEPREIAALQKAARLTWEGYQHLLSLLREGISEQELVLAFEMFCKQRGASALSFDPIVAFGENSAYPHYRAGKATLQQNQLVLIDVGAVVDHYCGDMTRTHFFGQVDAKLTQFAQWVREAQSKAVQAIRPGVKLGELDAIVRKEFDAHRITSLYCHSLGHGVGLEVHEYPRITFDGPDKDLELKAGMVLTIEPGLYQPGLGGIRYEDTIVVTETGVHNFYA